MLDWNIETKHGQFQSGTLEGGINYMIKYYAENKEDVDEIISIEAYQDGEIVQQLSESEINKVHGRIEREIRQWKKEVEAEYEHQQQIIHEFRRQLI